MSDDIDAVSRALVTRFEQITAERGETQDTMEEICDLLKAFAATPAFKAKYDPPPPGSLRLAEGPNGSDLRLYTLENWTNSGVEQTHCHNYWQCLVAVRGAWHDTIWQAIPHGGTPGAPIPVARRDVIREGEHQIIAPREPHGWEPTEVRTVSGTLVLLFWLSTGREEIARTAVNVDTGETEEVLGSTAWRERMLRARDAQMRRVN